MKGVSNVRMKDMPSKHISGHTRKDCHVKRTHKVCTACIAAYASLNTWPDVYILPNNKSKHVNAWLYIKLKNNTSMPDILLLDSNSDRAHKLT